MLFKGFLFFARADILLSEWKHCSNFGKGALQKQFCEIILQSGHWPKRRCHLKVFFYF